MQTFDVVSGGNLSTLTANPDIHLYIPFLSRVYINTSQYKKLLYSLLHKYKEVSTCIEYLQQVNWEEISDSTKNEMLYREKIKTSNDFREGSIVESLGEQLLSEFENGEYHRRARFVGEIM